MSASPRLIDASRLDRAPACDRSRLRARPADQRRRPGRQVRPRRAAAHHRGSRGGARRSPPSSNGSTRNGARSRRWSATRPRQLGRRQGNRAVAIVAAQGWHPGVIGIVAGRLKEKLGRPAIVIALDEDGIGKGSGRSIGGVDLGAAVLAAKDSGPADRRRRPCDGGRADRRRRPDRRARRLPRRTARRRRQPRPRRPRLAARRGARAGRGPARSVRRARSGRALWRRLAGAARRRRAGRHHQGRCRRQRPFAR